ncbi:MAG: hypothetical protein JWM40_984 [Frankiales bacterium]|nr:hypothetical protein [Frankiales bacterium]
MAQLDRAVAGVTGTRAHLVDALDANQAAATQLDRTDALCAVGDGTAARASFVKSLPLTRAARLGRIGLPAALAEYRRALAALQSASAAVSGGARKALTAVVRDGNAEAAAVEDYRHGLDPAWPPYDALSADEDVWSTHAVAGWYRSRSEGAAAYSVLVGAKRPVLEAARTRLARAASVVAGPIGVQSATLTAANTAMQGLH